MAKWSIYTGLVIEGVNDELFWHIARSSGITMAYYGGDAYIERMKLPRGFIYTLPEHLRIEWKAIRKCIGQKKHHRLEIHPATLSDRWDETYKSESAQEFMDAINHGKPLFEKRFRSG